MFPRTYFKKGHVNYIYVSLIFENIWLGPSILWLVGNSFPVSCLIHVHVLWLATKATGIPRIRLHGQAAKAIQRLGLQTDLLTKMKTLVSG